MSDAEIARVAKGLTEAQNRWMSGKGAGKKCTIALMRMGLIESYGSGFHVLPLGLSVRQYLEQNP